MMENDDKLLASFFAEQKQEPADNGFSRHVMQRLPRRNRNLQRLYSVWNVCCFALAIAIFFALDGLQLLWYPLREAFMTLAENGSTSPAEPQSLLLAVAVLLFLGYKKIASLA